VGFTPEQLAAPLDWDSMPRYPEDTLCSWFRRPEHVADSPWG
jgi:hypothetical protein